MNFEQYMLPCPTKAFFGIECFGCGTQRALLLVFQGRFADAFHMYPAIYTLILFMGIVAASVVDNKRNYTAWLIPLGILNAVIIVVSYFIKHF